MSDHRSIANLIAVETAPREKRVIAVQFEHHDPLACDGQHLDIDVSGFLRCPVSGCLWEYDPETTCPAHGGIGNA